MPTEELAIPICRHLKTNGLRCQSPALKGEPFCYFHARLHKHHPAPLTAREIVDARDRLYHGYEEAVIGGGEDPMQIARAYPIQNEFNFPPLEDAASIQLAASMLFHAIAQGHVHLRRARLLRDLLRVAAVSCRLNQPNPDVTTCAVRDLDHTPEGVAIARADAPSDPGPEQPSAPEAAAIARADTPSEEIDPAPAQPTVPAPPTPSAPEPPSSSPELTSNQDFAPNPFADNILPQSPTVTNPDSEFYEFFHTGYGSPGRDSSHSDLI